MTELDKMPLDLFLAQAIASYYQNNDIIFGQKGDFITASHSQLFCQSLASWVYLRLSEQENLVTLVELGPGQAKVMVEILTFLSRDPKIFSKIDTIVLVEFSDKLVEIQKKALEKFPIQVIHYKDCLQFKPDKPFIFLANEFFDALPIKQFIKVKGEYYEVWVDNLETKIILPAKALSLQEIKNIMSCTNLMPQDLPDGSLYEQSLVATNLLDNLARQLISCGGAGIILDYGYIKSPLTSTIRAIKDHKILEDFIGAAGESDLSAEVDFFALMRLLNNNFPQITTKLVSQIDFLQENFLDQLIQMAEKIAKNDEEKRAVQAEKAFLLSMKKFQVLELLS